MKLKNYLFAATMLLAATLTGCKNPEVDEIQPSVKLQQDGAAVTALEIPAEAATLSVDVLSNVSWEITDDADWLTIAPAKHENASAKEDKTTVTLTVTANETVGAARKANITVTAGTADVKIALTQKGAEEPEPEKTTIADVKAAEAEGEFTLEGLTVVAVNTRSAMLTDGTDYILAYLNAVPEVAVGEIVTVTGTTSTYGELRQFGSGITLTKTGTNAAFAQPTAVEVSTADLQAIVATPVIKYVKYSGSLTISGNYYNVLVEGLEGAQGSLAYPSTELVPADYNGAIVTVTGYTSGVTGSTTKYINTIVVNIEKEEAPIEYTEAAIKDITAAGNYIVKGATVVALYKRGYLVADAEMNAILVFLGKDAEYSVTVGDVVDLKGTVSEYQSNMQFIAGTVATVNSNSPLDVKYDAVAGAMIESYTKGYMPGIVEGTLSISASGYYNVTIEGTTKVGSISYPIDGVIDAALDGKKVKITGWSIGLSKSGETTFFNMIATSVEEVTGGGGDDPDPIEPQTYTWIMETGDIVGGAEFIVDGTSINEPIKGKGTNPALDWVATGTLTTAGEYAVAGGSDKHRFKIGTSSNLAIPYILTTTGLSDKKITKITVRSATAVKENDNNVTVTVGGVEYINQSISTTNAEGHEYIGEGTSSGDIVITFTNNKPFYINSITIIYEDIK